MEDTLNHQNGPQLGPQTITNNKQAEDQDPKAQYSIPGILHFIQHEWARFELERSQWEVDKAELQARIAFLQGERKGQENLKNDLVRRIKMLEYALKQERAKFHKLKYGVELNQGDMKPPVMEDGSLILDSQLDADTPYTSVSNATWRQSRQLLRQYLQEIGYTDRIIDVRSTRVKTLLGLNNNSDNDENINRGPINGNESNKRANESYGRRTPAKKTQPGSLPEAMMLDTEAAVIANLDFLANADVDMDDDDDDDMNDDLDVSMDMEKSGKSISATAHALADISVDVDAKQQPVGQKSSSGGGGGTLISDVDREAIEMLNELNMISETENQKSKNTEEWVKTARPINTSSVDAVESTLGLGELAQLTVNNEAENSYDLNSSGKEAYRKTWNAKYTLRSHFDGVRTLAFHPTEPILVTGSEDHTVKLWNLQKTVPAKKSTSLDVEPLYTFRSHQGSVLCLTMGHGGTDCYSGGLDGHIFRWSLRHLEVIDPYEPYDPSVVLQTLTGHTDAVWRLASCHHHGAGNAYPGSGEYLASCSADGTVKLWLPANITPLLNTYNSDVDGTPTSVDFVRDEVNRIAVSYSSSHSVIFDTETGRPVIRLESDSSSTADCQINCLVCHPTLSLTITAHADRHIRFWDNNSGKIVHSMVAHLDEVTSLAVDPNGLYLLSGSHDCSIRIWHLDNKTCVQEITAHRKKFDESILDVAFHPTRPFIASAGADGLAKVFV